MGVMKMAACYQPFFIIQLVMKTAMGVDHCTFLSQRQASCSFIAGPSQPLSFSTGRV